MGTGGRPGGRRGWWRAATVVVLVVLLGVALRWGIPAAVRRGLHVALTPYGLDATMARVAVGWDGALHCDGIVLRDGGGRPWAGARRVDLRLVTLLPPGWGVVVAGAWIDTDYLPTVAAAPGGWPGWLPPPATVALTLGNGPAPSLGITAERRAGGYEVAGEAASVHLAGHLHGVADGVRVDHLVVSGAAGLFAGPLVATVGGGGGRIEVGGPSGAVAGGWLTTHMVLRRGADGGLAYSASVDLLGGDLASFASLLPEAARISRGRLDLQLLASGRGGTLHAGGRLQATDADLTRLALTRALLAAVGIDDATPLAHARFDATFEVAGAVITATMGRIASDLPDMNIELGSWLNLATGALDARLTLAAADRLARLPVVGRAAPLLRSLTRLHLTGRWDQEAAVVVTRE